MLASVSTFMGNFCETSHGMKNILFAGELRIFAYDVEINNRKVYSAMSSARCRLKGFENEISTYLGDVPQ